MTVIDLNIKSLRLSRRLQNLLTDRRPLTKSRVKEITSNERKSLANIAAETLRSVDDYLRTRAIAALALRGNPEDVAILTQIVQNSKEDSRLRLQSVKGLGHLPGPEAEQSLIHSLAIKEEVIHIRAIQALGRIGTSNGLEALRQLTMPASPAESKAVRLAKALISFRHDLNQGDMPFVPGRTGMPVNISETLPVTVVRVKSRKVKTARDALEGGEYGISVHEKSGMEVKCGRARWVLLLNELVAGRGLAKAIVDRKMILGLLARYARENRTYSVQYILLSRPRADTSVELMGYRSDGTHCYSGTVAVRQKYLDFSVSDLDRPGTAPAIITGSIDSRKINLDKAVTARYRTNKRKTTEIAI